MILNAERLPESQRKICDANVLELLIEDVLLAVVDMSVKDRQSVTKVLSGFVSEITVCRGTDGNNSGTG